MDEENQVIQFETRSRKPSNSSKLAGREDATKAAQMILSSYPDFGKASPEYIVNVIDVLATFPAWVLPRLCNLREGIPARCSYIPTISDIVKLGDSIIAIRESEQRREERLKEESQESEKRAEWWAGRLKVLEKARAKYKTAFLTPDGEIKYYPTIETADVVNFDVVKKGVYEFAVPDDVKNKGGA